ncbi:XdhC family protein [Egicoccus halophilus]|uniref:Xanthine dehydrogenase accessory factor n=1 Tax=Egicoccus halophilus TaxID=1670830 RepID=A0A8J3EVI7_9ACTN|nr:XdhC family protein [Egicoccus halophilus]GGI09802.1 xanthine dehydrogenase accessory factor [Egicoccus halophilus]
MADATDRACEVAHGTAADTGDMPEAARRLVAVYAGAVASYLLHWGREVGFQTVLLEPDRALVTRGHRAGADAVHHDPSQVSLHDADVVVTDHHRGDLGAVMAPLVRARPRWIGILGSPRHDGPHHAALAAEGVDEALIATVRRPIGLDIGSKTPAEIALSTLAGLLADRNGRAGGVHPAGA